MRTPEELERYLEKRNDEYEVSLVRVCRRKNFVSFDEARQEATFADSFRVRLETSDGSDYSADRPTLAEALIELGLYLRKREVNKL